jgi:cation transport ATPase
MWCPACAWIIDESLKKSPGIFDSACNFSTDRLQVVYDPVKITPHQIIETIGKLGYRAAAAGESEKTPERHREFVRFAVSAFLTMNIMMLSFALYTGFFTDLSPENAAKISWPMFVMATAVLIYGGYDFYKKAWAGLRNAAFSMETLIIIGALSAYFFSTYNLFAGSIHLYYDTASMLITLVLLGKTLERRAKGKVLEDLKNFFGLMPTKVRICSNDFPEGRYAAMGQLAEGDIFRVTQTELVPADGRIVTGNGAVEESSLTGEPLPITKKPGDFIRSGARVQQGSFNIKAKNSRSDDAGHRKHPADQNAHRGQNRRYSAMVRSCHSVAGGRHRHGVPDNGTAAGNIYPAGCNRNGYLLSLCSGNCHPPGPGGRHIHCRQKGHSGAEFFGVRNGRPDHSGCF